MKKFIKADKIILENPGNEKAIHKLRISIKRVKAFLKYLERIDPDFDYKQTYKPWQTLFKEVGIYRNRQVFHKKFESICQSINIHKVSPEPGKEVPGFDKKVCKALLETTRKIKQKGLTHATNKYLKKRFRKITEITNEAPETRKKKLHILRKLLKEISFNLKFLGKDYDLDFPFKKLNSWLDKIMDNLGIWHDNILILKKLAQRIQKNNHKQEDLIMKDCIQKENVVLLNKINRLLDNGKMKDKIWR